MLKSLKLSAALAGVVLMLGLTGAHAADTAAPAGKATITVTVVDADSKPISGAKVSLMPAKAAKAAAGKKTADPAPTTPPAAGDKPKAEALQTATTDDSGKATLTAVADGSYSVTSRSKGFNGKATVTIADGKDASVTVTMKARKPKA